MQHAPSAVARGSSWWVRVRGACSLDEWRRVLWPGIRRDRGACRVVRDTVGVHRAAPFSLDNSGVFGIGVGITAYTLGLTPAYTGIHREALSIKGDRGDRYE
jgi:hypothetical protein